MPPSTERGARPGPRRGIPGEMPRAARRLYLEPEPEATDRAGRGDALATGRIGRGHLAARRTLRCHWPGAMSGTNRRRESLKPRHRAPRRPGRKAARRTSPGLRPKSVRRIHGHRRRRTVRSPMRQARSRCRVRRRRTRLLAPSHRPAAPRLLRRPSPPRAQRRRTLPAPLVPARHLRGVEQASPVPVRAPLGGGEEAGVRDQGQAVDAAPAALPWWGPAVDLAGAPPSMAPISRSGAGGFTTTFATRSRPDVAT